MTAGWVIVGRHPHRYSTATASSRGAGKNLIFYVRYPRTVVNCHHPRTMIDFVVFSSAVSVHIRFQRFSTRTVSPAIGT